MGFVCLQFPVLLDNGLGTLQGKTTPSHIAAQLTSFGSFLPFLQYTFPTHTILTGPEIRDPSFKQLEIQNPIVKQAQTQNLNFHKSNPKFTFSNPIYIQNPKSKFQIAKIPNPKLPFTSLIVKC